MTLYFSWNAWCQNMSSPDELIDIHEPPGVLLRDKSKKLGALGSENSAAHSSEDPNAFNTFMRVVWQRDSWMCVSDNISQLILRYTK